MNNSYKFPEVVKTPGGRVGGTNAPVVALDVIGGQRSFPVTLSFVNAGLTNAYVNCTNGNIFNITLTTNMNLNVTNWIPGWSGILNIRQDGTGSRTMTYDATHIRTNGSIVALTSTANSLDVMFMWVDDKGTNVNMVLQPTFK